MTRAIALCAHGTRDVAGRRIIGSLTASVRAALPHDRVDLVFVDVQPPALEDAATRMARDAVVVPVLLSRGYHVLHDMPTALGERPDVIVTSPLGPSEVLARLQIRRLREAGARDGDAVVVAVAGSSRDEGAEDAALQTELVARLWNGPVSLGYCSARNPRVRVAVDAARSTAERVVVSSYLLAPGFFQNIINDAGADLVAAPLGADTEVLETVLERVREA